MANDYRRINSGSRTALVKSSNLYGGQILTIDGTANDTKAVYDLGIEYQSTSTYTLSATVTSSNGNGVSGRVQITFEAMSSEESMNGTLYYDWVFNSMTGDLLIGSKERLDEGAYYYNVGEEISIDVSQFSNNEGYLTGIVTSVYPDRNYGYAFNHQILYDRYDRKMYIKIINDDGTEELIDFNGAPYTPSELPSPTSFTGYTRVSSTEILFNYNNYPLKINSVSVYKDELTVFSSSIYQSSIRVVTNEKIDYGVNYQFNLSFTDVLGELIEDTVTINIEDPGGTGEDYGFSSYINWTGSPYFIDESYHMVLYTVDDLVNMGLNNGSGVISRIGFPFHLVPGQGANLSNDEIEDGSFLLAASVTDIDVTKLDSNFVKEKFVSDNEFDTSVLDINSSKVPGVVETYNGQRYVFFRINHFHWDFSSNIIVTYWMDGPTPPSGGWNGGYVTNDHGAVEEVLAFSKSNNWLGENGVTGEKVALVFTTLV